MARTPQLLEFARRHSLKVITIADLIRYRLKHDRLVECTLVTPLPTRHGLFTAHAYRSLLDGTDHLALVAGRVHHVEGVLTRIHSESMLGDIFGSQRCDTGSQLDAALAAMAERGSGVLVYLRRQQGRGVGLSEELEAYSRSDPAACEPSAAVEDSASPVSWRWQWWWLTCGFGSLVSWRCVSTGRRSLTSAGCVLPGPAGAGERGGSGW